MALDRTAIATAARREAYEQQARGCAALARAVRGHGRISVTMVLQTRIVLPRSVWQRAPALGFRALDYRAPALGLGCNVSRAAAMAEVHWRLPLCSLPSSAHRRPPLRRVIATRGRVAVGHFERAPPPLRITVATMEAVVVEVATRLRMAAGAGSSAPAAAAIMVALLPIRTSARPSR